MKRNAVLALVLAAIFHSAGGELLAQSPTPQPPPSTLLAEHGVYEPAYGTIAPVGYDCAEAGNLPHSPSCGGQCACNGACNGACGGACGQARSCIDHSGSWVTIDYLLWQVSGYGVQPLVTSSPPDTDEIEASVLPGATILFGNENLENDLRSGARLRFGYWYDDWRTVGFEGSFLALGQESSNFFAASDGSTGSLGRPFFNDDPNVNAEDAFLIGFDDPIDGDFYTGSTRVTTSSNMYSGHFAWRKNIRQCGGHRLDFTAGYRFFRLDEGLQINDNITVDGVGGGIVGTNRLIEDQFNTSNAFHGAEIGLVSIRDHGCWSTELIAKLALGNNHTEVTIDGSVATTVPNFATVTTPGGLLTQATNMGQHRNDYFVVIPEVNANLNYQVSENWKLTLGYSVIFVSDVVRPGDQIDYNINGTLLQGPFAGPATPQFEFISNSVLVHGMNLGAQYNY